MSISKELSYLLGLMVGRGHIFSNSNILAIEFSHTNEFSYGIAHCPTCGYLATKQGDGLICKNKNCKKSVNSNNRKIYNQPLSTVSSLKNVIIPFLSNSIEADYDISGNNALTLLIIDFHKNKKDFDNIKTYLNNESSFDSFHIPDIIKKSDEYLKIEFINGLLDTAGFPSPGGWLNRDGKNGHGRMRVYFQFVRNWYLPVEVDNFLRKEFSLPIHTIDWGHPNIRDANMEDYFNARPTSWSREHQVKFFPEYYKTFHFRISYKQELFKELITHNEKVIFTSRDDWFPPSSIGIKKIKAYHPGEEDVRIPEPARKHFNAFWQINLAMGCEYITGLVDKAKNKEAFMLTGEDKKIDIEKIKKLFDIQSTKMQKEIFAKYESVEKKQSLKQCFVKNEKEKQLYLPLTEYLKIYIKEHYDEESDVFDTSANNLNLFLKNKNKELFGVFDYCEKFRIKPDVVGFLVNSKKIIFVEAKIIALDLKSLGQLIGYCFVAKPEEAILVSSQRPSISLIKILKARPDLLEYDDGKKIKLGVWENNKISLIEL